MKQINVDEDSWHFRLYKWWMEFSETKKPPEFRENLCHYARVVLIWAPLGWFFKAKVYEDLSPWIIVAVVLSIAGVLGAIVTYPLSALFVIALIAAAIILIVAIFSALYLLNKLPNVVANAILVITMPVWGPIVLLIKIAVAIWEKVIEPTWFKPHPWIIPVWFTTSALIMFFLRLAMGESEFTRMAFMAVFALTIGLFVCLAIFLGSRYLENRKNRKAAQVVKRIPKRKGGISTPNLFYRIGQAKVGRSVCPMINLPDQWTDEEPVAS